MPHLCVSRFYPGLVQKGHRMYGTPVPHMWGKSCWRALAKQAGVLLLPPFRAFLPGSGPPGVQGCFQVLTMLSMCSLRFQNPLCLTCGMCFKTIHRLALVLAGRCAVASLPRSVHHSYAKRRKSWCARMRHLICHSFPAGAEACCAIIPLQGLAACGPCSGMNGMS